MEFRKHHFSSISGNRFKHASAINFGIAFQLNFASEKRNSKQKVEESVPNLINMLFMLYLKKCFILRDKCTIILLVSKQVLLNLLPREKEIITFFIIETMFL